VVRVGDQPGEGSPKWAVKHSCSPNPLTGRAGPVPLPDDVAAPEVHPPERVLCATVWHVAAGVWAWIRGHPGKTAAGSVTVLGLVFGYLSVAPVLHWPPASEHSLPRFTATSNITGVDTAIGAGVDNFLFRHVGQRVRLHVLLAIDLVSYDPRAGPGV
jgi:hypothetical protein